MTSTALLAYDGHTAGALADRCGVPRIEVLSETASTLDVAHALAETDAPAGTVVVADSQRAGRGRQGRAWTSRAGQGVWCTVIERPGDAGVLDLLSVRIGLRLAEELDEIAGQLVRVKWPNDLVVRAGKIGGILAEARWSGAALAWVAVGVGINVVAPADVQAAAGLPGDTRRVDVLHAIVQAVRSAAAVVGDLSRDEQERYAARDALAGRDVVAPGVGRVAGVSARGSLMIDTANGREEYRTGTVRFAEGGRP
jgi:BirA family biotin operon repressor/biotin-[acetyl-CoA-carboxylase] ligase